MSEIFAHTIGRIDVVGGMVRLELAAMVPAEENKTKLEPRQVVVLPLEGFLNALGTMQELARRLVDAGVLKATPTEQPPAVKN